MGNHTNALNTLEQIKRETKDDARLYACIRDLYEQGVSLSDLKALIPDIRRTREQLQLKRMLQNNNEVASQHVQPGDDISSGCKRTPGRAGIQKTGPADPPAAILPESFGRCRSSKKTKTNLPVCLGSQTLCTHLTRPD